MAHPDEPGNGGDDDDPDAVGDDGIDPVLLVTSSIQMLLVTIQPEHTQNGFFMIRDADASETGCVGLCHCGSWPCIANAFDGTNEVANSRSKDEVCARWSQIS